MPDTFTFEEATEPATFSFEEAQGARPATALAPEEPGRETRLPQSAGQWGKLLLNKTLHPLKALETGVEQFAIHTGMASPGSRLLWSPAKQMETPVAAIPQIPQQKGKLAQVGAGAVNSVTDFINFFQTPEGIATLGLGSIPAALRKVVLGDFAVQMATAVPDQLTAAVQHAKKGDYQNATKEALGGVGGALLTTLLTREVGKPEPVAKEFTSPQPEPVPEGQAKVIPFPPEAKGGAGVAKPKGEEPVVPETPPEPGQGESAVATVRRAGARTIREIQELFPKAELNREQARELRDLAFPKEEKPSPPEVPDAIQRESQKVLPALPEQPPESTGKVPVEEGGKETPAPRQEAIAPTEPTPLATAPTETTPKPTGLPFDKPEEYWTLDNLTKVRASNPKEIDNAFKFFGITGARRKLVDLRFAALKRIERLKEAKGDTKEVSSPETKTEEKGQEGNVLTPPTAAEATPKPPEPITPPETPPSPQAMGIVPAMHRTAAVAAKLQRTYEGLKTAWATRKPKANMAAHMDAADNIARIAGAQRGNSVRLLVPNEMDRKAITFVIEANGDRAKLDEFTDQVATKDLSYRKIIEHAKANWNRLKPLADQVSDIMDRQRLFEEVSGIDTDEVEAYIKHAYDMDILMGSRRPVILAGGRGTGLTTGFRKQRVFDTYAQAIEAGFKPKSLDSAVLVDSRVAAGTKLVNRLNWGNALRDIVDPTSDKPIVTSLIRQPKGTEVPPLGYTVNEIIPGVRIAVHEGYESLFNALKGHSVIGELEVAGVPIGQLLLKTEGAIKHGILFIDSYHLFRIGQRDLSLMNTVSYKKGTSLLDYSDNDLSRAVSQKLITQEMSDYAKANRPVANLLIRQGLNVGQIQDALYADVAKAIPLLGRVAGPVNDFIFQKLTRGAMMESGIREFHRVKELSTELSDAEIARRVSRDINFYFGNIGRQGLFKSKTAQDLARLIFLAPQWVESMARTELRSVGQLAQGVAGKFDVGLFGEGPYKTMLTGTLARGVAKHLLWYFVATQLLNLAFRGKPTWENPEKGHKLDAFIPGFPRDTPFLGKRSNTTGYFFSPFGTIAELTHDMVRYWQTKHSLFDPIAKIITNKESPLTRAASVLMTGKDYSGTAILGTKEQLKAAAYQLAPLPILVKGAQKDIERQMASTVGLKIEPRYRDLPPIVAKYGIATREQFEGYLNSVAKDAQRLPLAQRMAYVNKRLEDDKVEGKYREEARNKLRFKIRNP